MGATTSTVTVDLDFENFSVTVGSVNNRESAGMPNARVFPLPVSAIPTTSCPRRAGGHAQAWMGVGSLNPLKAARSSLEIWSWEKCMTGISVVRYEGGVWMVMECFLKNSKTSSGDGFEAGIGDNKEVDNRDCSTSSSFLRFFFFSFDEEVPGSADKIFFSASRFRFFFFFSNDPFVKQMHGFGDKRPTIQIGIYDHYLISNSGNLSLELSFFLLFFGVHIGQSLSITLV